MQINGPVTPPAAANVVGPVPCLPVPGEVTVFGPDVTAHVAVPKLVYCTAVFLFDPASGARAMMHYNPMVGPRDPATFAWFARVLIEKYNAQAAALTVALFNNTTSSNGRAFPPTMYKTDRVKALLEHGFGAAHGNMAATHYTFAGTIGLMDAAGAVSGCPGPDIQGGVRAARMNWVKATPNTAAPQGDFLARPTV